ncbi:peroxidase 5-like [Musa acuminata AAA Group]|uniref:peroxidase 5-like n=1 Tax=Musa acuminata AAA Group TaxID=214697 RepID=UPI0031D9BF47
MALRRGATPLAIVVALCLIAATRTEAQLRVGFYCRICPKPELIVKQEVEKAVRANPGISAGLLRLHFHDCFVGSSPYGCDGSVLIDSTWRSTAEKDTLPDKSLRGFEVIDRAKRRLEAVYRGKVSCADILAFAASDSVSLVILVNLQIGGNAVQKSFYQVPAGRRDGRISRAADVIDLPPPAFNLSLLDPFFTKKGSSLDDMITLSVSYLLCPSFANRLYNYNKKASCPVEEAMPSTEQQRGAHGFIDPLHVRYQLLQEPVGEPRSVHFRSDPHVDMGHGREGEAARGQSHALLEEVCSCNGEDG